MTLMIDKRLVHFIGRRMGRRLLPQAQQLVDEWLPKIAIDPKCDEPICVKALFPGLERFHLEIGFGGGEHLAELARRNPDVGFFGCEPFMNGVARLLAEVERDQIENIRIFTDDARWLMERLPENSIEKTYILFPDPWPKLRHHKRRIVKQETLQQLARIQAVGTQLQLATDHEDYVNWMLEALLGSEAYHWSAQSQADWREEPADWVPTRYQQKTTAQGRLPYFFEAVRV